MSRPHKARARRAQDRLTDHFEDRKLRAQQLDICHVEHLQHPLGRWPPIRGGHENGTLVRFCASVPVLQGYRPLGLARHGDARTRGNRSFTANANPVEPGENAKRRPQVGFDCGRLASISRGRVLSFVTRKIFSQASSRCYRRVYPKLLPIAARLPALSKSALPFGRTANLSSISVLARRLKLTGP